MQRRSPPADGRRRTERVRRVQGVLLLAVCALWLPASARAEGVTGSLDAIARLSPHGRHGAGVVADALWGGETFRAGLTLGIDAVRRGAGETSAVYTPVGVALSLRLLPSQVGALFVAGRTGAGLGAQQGGFFVGPFAAGSAGYAFRLGDAAAIRLGFELMGIWTRSRDETWLSPFVGLAF